MTAESNSSFAPIVPERCYRDARAGIAFLERAFGFTPALVVPGSGETIAHAELWSGRACMMIASIDDAGPWQYRSPQDIGGANTGSPYIATADIDALYDRAVAAGCSIASDLADTEYGSRDFSVRDLEGFLWHFGTYRPQHAQTPSTAAEAFEPELFAGARYTDARAAIAWLGKAFGAVEQYVVPGEGDDVAHAQLLLGDTIYMLGTDHADRFNTRPPRRIGGVITQSLNAFVADPDAHYARATAAGAEILRAPENTPYGARGYVTRDCEGYVWNFSTYVPARSTAATIAG